MEGHVSKGSTKRIAVVTGANKGIGLEICKQLASNGIMVLLTARDQKRGIEAVSKLKDSGVSDVLFHQLDVADPLSVASLANFVKTRFGKLDILVNNAAVGGLTVDHESLTSIQKEENGSDKLMKLLEQAQETYEIAKECLNINYYGIKRAVGALIHLLQLSQSPRIVNVSSAYGKLSLIPGENIRKEMSIIDEHTEERLDRVIESFLNDFKEGKLEANGWPTRPSAYKVSKVAMNAYTKVLAEKYRAMCINCVAPGFVKTDMNYNIGILTVEEGAKGPVMLALLPDGSPSGLFYNQTVPSSFD